MTQARTARLLRINPKTVALKLDFLAAQAKLSQKEYLKSLRASGQRLTELQFDEMESFEISKCLPLSIPLAVVPGTRKILGFRVSEMPAKGPLAQISRAKYGPRRDDRGMHAKSLFEEIAPLLDPKVVITSDQNPKYPSWIKSQLPQSIHKTVKGQRGCVVGQGELKKTVFDPLFSLNHTCAMLRANVARLVRKTWCTTKRRDRLESLIAIYVDYHNTVLTA